MNTPRGFRLDVNRCVGCQACVIACGNENRLPAGAPWRHVHTFNGQRHPGLPVMHFTLACNHCGEPACLKNCPAGAYAKDPVTGVVALDPERCVGCRYCSWVCPFDAPTFNPAQGVMEKCTGCAGRLAEGRPPACIAGCPTGALQWADIPATGPAESVPGFPATALQPSIRFSQSRRRQPESTAPPDPAAVAALFPAAMHWPARKITFRSEWALSVFTSVAALLVALVGGQFAGVIRPPPGLFLAAGLAGMALSTRHLGRKARAFRAVVNWRQSWLSREIILFSGFLALGWLYLAIFPDSRPLGVATWLSGLAALAVIDRVYQVATKVEPGNFHSAQVLWTGLFLTGAFTGKILLFAPFGALKLGLYLYRKALPVRPAGPGQAWLRLAVSAFRAGLGFLLPLAVIILTNPQNVVEWRWLALAGIILGEWIDRGEYYSEIDILTPGRQVLLDLETHLAHIKNGRLPDAY